MRNIDHLTKSWTLAIGLSLLGCGGQAGGGDGGAQASRIDGGARSARDTGTPVPAEAVAVGCPAQQTKVTNLFPAATTVALSQGSALWPERTGGTLEDGTYYLVNRTMRGNGGTWRNVGAVLVVAGSHLKYFNWHTQPSTETGPTDSAQAGPVINKGTFLDTSGMKQCWGNESLPNPVEFSASATEISLSIGSTDCTFRRKAPADGGSAR